MDERTDSSGRTPAAVGENRLPRLHLKSKVPPSPKPHSRLAKSAVMFARQKRALARFLLHPATSGARIAERAVFRGS
jgi:hypothetical protein